VAWDHIDWQLVADVSKNPAAFNFGAAQEHDLENGDRKLL
jgi:hypothetical protein